MAELIGTISAIVGLIEFTDSLVSTIIRFVRAVGEAPEVINSVRIQITTWQTHLDALYGFSRRPNISSPLKHFLERSGVLGNAQECLERLTSIISSAMPPEHGQTRASEIWDRVAFRRKYGGEVEDLLKQMHGNTKHLQLALELSTA